MWIGLPREPDDRPLRWQESLGPLTMDIAAPRETVFDVVAAPYLGRTPRAMADKLRVLDRGSDLVVADHFTPIFGGRLVATTRETVLFDRPERVTFRLLQGPVACVEEQYLLESVAEGTRFTYRGRLGSNLPIVGRWWARTNARTWVSVVEDSVQQIAAEAARRSRARPG